MSYLASGFQPLSLLAGAPLAGMSGDDEDTAMLVSDAEDEMFLLSDPATAFGGLPGATEDTLAPAPAPAAPAVPTAFPMIAPAAQVAMAAAAGRGWGIGVSAENQPPAPAPAPALEPAPAPQYQPILTSRFDADYELLGGPLETGRHTRVFFCQRRRDGKAFVVKSSVSTAQALLEIDAHFDCREHPSVLPITAVYDNVLHAGHDLLPPSCAYQRVSRLLLLVTPRMDCDLFTYIVQQPCSDYVLKYFARQMLAAIAHVHARGWVHADIKPENFLVDLTRMRVYLMDFGHVVAAGEAPTEPRGTQGFHAPEVIASYIHYQRHGSMLVLEPASDVWALGVALHAMVAQLLPFGLNRGDSNLCSDSCGVPDVIRHRIALNARQGQAAVARRSLPLRQIIDAALHPTAEARPTATQLLAMPFFAN